MPLAIKELDKALNPLKKLKEVASWSGFFERIERLRQLDEIILAEPMKDYKNSLFCKEAARKVRWLQDNRVDLVCRVSNLEEYEALVLVYDFLLKHERFATGRMEPPE